MPIERAVPAMIFSAASIVVALRSGIFVSAICRSCAAVSVPTLVLCGSALPLSTPTAFLISSGAGGVLVMNVNDRSSKIVISTGMMLPRWASVAALYCRTKSMMLTPCGPSAVPTGGAGVAAPAFSWTLTTAAIFFFLGAICLKSLSLSCLSCSDLADLVEGQLHRRLSAEDRHEHLQFLGIGVDLADRRWQRRERAVHNGNRLVHLEVHGGGPQRLGLLGRLLLRHRREQGHDLVQAQRRRPAGQANEAGHARGIAHRCPRLVGQVHPHQDVSGQNLLLHLLSL